MEKRMFLRNKGAYSWLIAGLGNPEPKYEQTRHNAGFLAIDRLAEKRGASIKKMKFHALTGEAEISGERCLLLKPLTFMNLSGEAVEEASQFYKIPPERILVLFDDISLEPGRLRIRRKGSDGGHNGIKSIIHCTGADTFPRVKIGVGKKPHPDYDLAAWVLSRFTKEEMTALSCALDHAADAVELVVAGKTEEAMNRFNS